MQGVNSRLGGALSVNSAFDVLIGLFGKTMQSEKRIGKKPTLFSLFDVCYRKG